ncbi:molecular chaperone HscA [Nocardia sp. GAS34]|uniref:Hsp70 family protein n=1 Tax=unclassified Nocardia TaxID=2637762 RepID=UPI003D194D4E
MSSVVGISVGGGAIRVAYPHAGNSAQEFAPDRFDLHTTPVGEQPVEEVAAEAIAAVLTRGESGGEHGVAATAIAYRSEQHARAVRIALARRQLTNYELMPEAAAAVEFAQAAGRLQGVATIALYDFGATGLSVSVVDVATRQVHNSERTSEISGDYLDLLIREQQIASGRIAHPPDAQGLAELDELCRSAKEQLSTTNAVALPSEYGLLLLSQENLDALIMLAVESSARMTRDVIVRSDRAVQAVLAIGGGAQIPQVARVVERSLRVPVVVPEQPETVVARGAALLARPGRTVAESAVSFDAKTEVLPVVRADDSLSARHRRRRRGGTPVFAGRVGQLLGGRRAATGKGREAAASAGRELALGGKRELSVAGVAVAALVVVAALGLALGWGPQVLQGDSQSTKTTQTPVTTSAPQPVVLAPTIAPSTPDSTNDSIAAPPPYRHPAQSSAPPRPGANTIVVVPGLPAIVVPTLPPLLPQFQSPQK